MGRKKKQEELEASTDFASLCAGTVHPKALEGIELFNAGKYWHAHEALEEAWIEERGPARHLYKGILQAGVMYLQIERRNFIGMAKMYERAQKWLAPWPDECRGLAIGKLRNDIERAIEAAGKLGPEKLGSFDRSLFRPIKIQRSG